MSYGPIRDRLKRKQTVVFSGAGLDWAPFEVKASDIEDDDGEDEDDFEDEPFEGDD